MPRRIRARRSRARRSRKGTDYRDGRCAAVGAAVRRVRGANSLPLNQCGADHITISPALRAGGWISRAGQV